MTFFQDFIAAFESGDLLKCTLSRPSASASAELKNIYIRPVSLKKGLFLAFTYRYKTRDEVKNYAITEAVDLLTQSMGQSWLHASLFTPTSEVTLSYDKKGVASVVKRVNAQPSTTANMAHDRAKKRLLDPATPWLHRLGITSVKGAVLPTAQDKWKQINKYLEIIGGILREQSLPADLHIADMGSGKGYLTFALYDFLVHHEGLNPLMVGIELRQNLVDLCNGLAQEVGFGGLTFVAQDISTYQPTRLDMLIALHACDTATDLALAAGIHNNAQVIVAAPCCHKQVRRDMKTQNELACILKHGILEERQAEIVTDGIRALILEREGYKTQVFEFISSEHTAKNVMITALKQKKKGKSKADIQGSIDLIKVGFGLERHFLEGLVD